MREGFTDRWAEHGTPLCVLRCMSDAQLTIDGVPHCVDCADLVIEREVAISLRPDLIDTLPPLTAGREAYEAFRRSQGPATDRRSLSGDSDELRALRAQWEAAGRPGRPSADAPGPKTRQRVGLTRVEPLAPEPAPERPAGQISLLADEE